MSKQDSEIYHIYGRKEFPEPLEFVREVQAREMDVLAGEDENWVELVAFPASAVIRVIPWEEDDE